MLTRRRFVSLSALAVLGACAPGILHGCASPALGEEPVAGQNDAQPAKLVTFAFDTVIGIEASCSQRILDEVEARLRYFEQTFSKTVTTSDVYAINHADGMPTRVQPETADLIERALGYSQLSDGLFDITIGSVTDLWDFKNGIVPNDEMLAEALEHVDWRTIGLDGRTVTLTDPFARIDLGGIAKGFIADDIVALLRARGCESALINLGGNTYALGARPDGTPWDVGLQDPRSARGTLFGNLSVENRSVVASGINERSFEKDGTTYHHLLDPRTGMPMRNGTASATIVSERSLDGDAFSTTAFLLGAEAGAAFIAQQEGIDVVFVKDDGSVVSSAGLEVELA